MTEVLSAMLDELMGQYRNEAPENRKEVSFTQDFVCKYFLAGYCPNELFTNTKFDLGICNMSHDEKFKKMYEEDKRFGKLGYEERWEKFLRRMCDDMDVKIRKARERLELTQPPEAMELIDSKRYALVNDMILLNQQLKQVQAQKQALLDSFATSRVISNKMDFEANVEAERQTLEKFEEEIEKIRVMRKGAHKLLRDHDMSHGNSQNTMAGKAMDVCNTCGCFTCHGDSIYLDSDDTELCCEAPQRVVDHLQGKLHSGFTELRKTLAEIDKKREMERSWREKQREDERKKRDEERKVREAEREKERAEKEKKREEERKARKELEKTDDRKRSRSPREKDRKRLKRDDDRRRSSHKSNHERDRRRDRDEDRDRRRKRSRSRSKSKKTRRSRSRDRRSSKHLKRSRSRDRKHDRSTSKERDELKTKISERESPERPPPLVDAKTDDKYENLA